MEGYYEIPIHCNPTMRSRGATKQIHYIDLLFGKEIGTEFSLISFDNFYTSSISVWGQAGSKPFACILPSKTLMPRPDCEGGSQSPFVINVDEFNQEFASVRSGFCLRVFPCQPCPQWELFEIRNIKAFGRKAGSAPGASVGASTAAPVSTYGGSRDSAAEAITIQKMVACDISCLLEAKRRECTAGSLVSQDYPLDRYRRDGGKKKEKRRSRKH